MSILLFSSSAALPDVREHPPTATPNASIVYSEDGKEITRFFREHRVPIKIEDISPNVIDALVATEDHRFYDHGGIDFRRLVSSAWLTLRGERQGASTITMQLARNRYPSIHEAPLYRRKMMELLMARRLESVYSKDLIIEHYLNTVPFGPQAHGISAAAGVYYDKPASELTVDEAATLIGILKATTRYSPLRYPERAIERRNVVMRQMERHGHLTSNELEELRQRPLTLNHRSPGISQSMAPHFAEHVRKEVADWAQVNGYDPYSDGLRIHTTLDSRLQEKANDALNRQLELLQRVVAHEWSSPSANFLSANPEAYPAENAGSFGHLWNRHSNVLDDALRRTTEYQNLRVAGHTADEALEQVRSDDALVAKTKRLLSTLQGGLVAIDMRSGNVRAWVGGRDFINHQYDHVAQAQRQPGSTFKPFIYAAAIDRGYMPNDRWYDGNIRPPDRQNSSASQQSTGNGVSLRDGLARSHNDLAQHLTNRLGPVTVVRMAEQMGISSELRPYPSIAFGTSEVNLLEMTAAYATFGNRGQYRSPQRIRRIEDRHGRTLKVYQSDERRALSAYTSYTVLDMMRGTVDGGTGTDLRRRFQVEGDVAGKTGTTQANADGWFVMIHPELAIGAWSGFSDRRIAFRTNHWGQGARNALRIAGDFTRSAQQEELLRTDLRFNPPPGYRPPSSRLATHPPLEDPPDRELNEEAPYQQGIWRSELEELRSEEAPSTLEQQDSDVEAALRGSAVDTTGQPD